MKKLLFLLFLLVNNEAIAEITVQKYCAMVRDSAHTISYIKIGLKMREDSAAFLNTKPTEDAVKIFQGNLNAYVKNMYEKDLANAYEADNKINQQYPNNKFPQFVVDQVVLQKLVLSNAFDNGGSEIANREWVYNHCNQEIGKLK